VGQRELGVAILDVYLDASEADSGQQGSLGPIPMASLYPLYQPSFECSVIMRLCMECLSITSKSIRSARSLSEDSGQA
jgi:hypothetical protein